MLEEAIKQLLDEALFPLQQTVEALRQEVSDLRLARQASRMLRTKEAAALLGLSKETISRWCRGVLIDGTLIQLKATRLPKGQYIIDEEELRRFSEQISAARARVQPSLSPEAVGYSLTRQYNRRSKSK